MREPKPRKEPSPGAGRAVETPQLAAEVRVRPRNPPQVINLFAIPGQSWQKGVTLRGDRLLAAHVVVQPDCGLLRAGGGDERFVVRHHRESFFLARARLRQLLRGAVVEAFAPAMR